LSRNAELLVVLEVCVPTLFVAALLAGCTAPPDAPEGLDDSVKHLYRGVYGSAEEVGAGLTGLMNWFDKDGGELLDATADLDSVGAFSLSALGPQDVAHVALEDDPDPGLASGVVSLAEMRCSWDEAERWLVRRDQDVVFEGDFDSYSRTYDTSRATFEDASDNETFAPIEETLTDATLTDSPSTILLTTNDAASTEIGVTIPFELALHFRHGIWEVQGEEVAGMMILGYFPRRAESDGGANAIEQNYSIDINLARGKGKTLRVFGNWTELTSLFDSDSAVVLTTAVNKAQASAERLSQICAGDVTVGKE